MLVRMKNGNVEYVLDEVACNLINRRLATRFAAEADALILKAEEQGGTAACVGIELATLEPKVERSVVKFFRTLRSR